MIMVPAVLTNCLPTNPPGYLCISIASKSPQYLFSKSLCSCNFCRACFALGNQIKRSTTSIKNFHNSLTLRMFQLTGSSSYVCSVALTLLLIVTFGFRTLISIVYVLKHIAQLEDKDRRLFFWHCKNSCHIYIKY